MRRNSVCMLPRAHDRLRLSTEHSTSQHSTTHLDLFIQTSLFKHLMTALYVNVVTGALRGSLKLTHVHGYTHVPTRPRSHSVPAAKSRRAQVRA